jgi:hypothetical protein
MRALCCCDLAKLPLGNIDVSLKGEIGNSSGQSYMRGVEVRFSATIAAKKLFKITRVAAM